MTFEAIAHQQMRRRTFLKLVGLCAVGVTATACAPSLPTPQPLARPSPALPDVPFGLLEALRTAL